MKNKKLLLVAINLIAIAGGLFAFKVQHRFAGRYFCAGTYSGTWYRTTYTTSPIGVTLYCTLILNQPKTKTFKVTVNL